MEQIDISAIFATIIVLAAYFYPTLVALHRRAEWGLVLLGNLFGGWTGIGWFWSLISALCAPLKSDAPSSCLREE